MKGRLSNGNLKLRMSSMRLTYVPRASMKRCREADRVCNSWCRFDVRSGLPVFPEQVTGAQKFYSNDNSTTEIDLKGTVRAVIKQLEGLDQKNMFKLKSETETWIQGGKLAGIGTI